MAFLRITIDHIGWYFAPGEVDEIWVTFPDPQIKKERKRLVGPHFVNDYYRQIWPEAGGILHLKSDSDFLYEYLLETAQDLSARSRRHRRLWRRLRLAGAGARGVAAALPRALLGRH